MRPFFTLHVDKKEKEGEKKEKKNESGEKSSLTRESDLLVYDSKFHSNEIREIRILSIHNGRYVMICFNHLKS